MKNFFLLLIVLPFMCNSFGIADNTVQYSNADIAGVWKLQEMTLHELKIENEANFEILEANLKDYAHQIDSIGLGLIYNRGWFF